MPGFGSGHLFLCYVYGMIMETNERIVELSKGSKLNPEFMNRLKKRLNCCPVNMVSDLIYIHLSKPYGYYTNF